MTNNDMQLKDARISYYKFLSRIYSTELTTEMLKVLTMMDTSAEMDNASIKQGLERLKKFINDIPSLDEFAADYAKIFLAAGEAKGNAAFPYESVYTSKEKLLMQEAWEQVKKLYVSKGIALKNASADIKEDHISFELIYMAYLIENNSDDEAYTFLNEHLLNWIENFVKDIEKYAMYDIYPAIGRLTLGFLEIEKEYLQNKTEIENEIIKSKSYTLSHPEINKVIEQWKKEYRIFAPKLQSANGNIRYGEISSITDIYNDQTSHFSAKEVYYPIMQTMFYFNENDVVESKLKDDRDIILFLHPCDINALRRTDNIFLKNGQGADLYYERLRSKIRIVLLECKESYNSCFCVSMNSNKTDNYEMAIRITNDCVKIQVKEKRWNHYFTDAKSTDFTPRFITENKQKVITPIINNKEELKIASNLKFWETFDEQCI